MPLSKRTQYQCRKRKVVAGAFFTPTGVISLASRDSYLLQENEQTTYKSQNLASNWSQDMKIVPVNFNSEHKAMLGHCKMILETDGGRIAINPDRFDKLITALRTAVDNDGTLDKEATLYNDIFDAFD
jgi:hypothetical protein